MSPSKTPRKVEGQNAIKQTSVFQAKHDQQAWTRWPGSARGSLQQPGA